MNNLYLLITTLLSIATFQTQAQNVNIPDPTFKVILIGNQALNTNGDNEIQVSEAQAYTGIIDVGQANVASFAGIDQFPNITGFRSYYNTSVTQINLTNNTAVTAVICSNNPMLSSLALPNTPTLSVVYCQYNNLFGINVSNNPNLSIFHCNNNINITNLNLSNNTALTELNCGVTGITSLDVSNNTQLKQLFLESSSSVASLDVSNLSELELLNTNHCPLITTLDLSNSPKLKFLYSEACALTAVNLQNGMNDSINSVFLATNPSLTCIQVDDVNWSTSNWSDPMNFNFGTAGLTSFNTACTVFTNTDKLESFGQAIQLYPNPTPASITVNLGQTYEDIQITIYNQLGQEVMQQTAYQVSQVDLNLEALSSGYYSINIQTELGKTILKAIKE